MEAELDRGDGTGSSPASVLAVLEGMGAAGLDVAALCGAVGLSRTDLDRRETLVPAAELAALWREGTRRYGRGTLGLPPPWPAHVPAGADGGGRVSIERCGVLRGAGGGGPRGRRLRGYGARR